MQNLWEIISLYKVISDFRMSENKSISDLISLMLWENFGSHDSQYHVMATEVPMPLTVMVCKWIKNILIFLECESQGPRRCFSSKEL